jgi:hypothetical protein
MEEADTTTLIPWLYNTCSLLSHYCPKTGWRQYVSGEIVVNNPVCEECHERIPDSVLAVWHLYNADEKAKYDKQAIEVEKTSLLYVEDFPTIWPDSKPLGDFNLFEDTDGHVYGANGELLNEEISEWNGSDDVLLFSHNESVLGASEDAATKMDATGVEE